MFRFASPWFLLLLILPWAWWLYQIRGLFWVARSCPGSGGGRSQSLQLASLGSTANRPVSPWLMGAKLLPLFKVVGISLMIFALARPQAGDQKIAVDTQGVNIVLALDLSESMRALDFKQDNKIVTRLDAVKGVVSQFIMERQGDRIGLVVFGSQAYTQLPLTQDYNTIAFMLDHLEIGAAGPQTAIGDAIGISLKRLEDQDAKSNLIILLTDGKSNAGSLDWDDAAKLAARKGVKIHTIGVGSQGKAPFLVDTLFGKQYVYQNVEVDWDALESIALATGGAFFKAQDTQGLERIYELINEMETTKARVDKWVEYQEWYPGFLVAGLVIYLLCQLLSNTRLIQVP